MTNNPKWPPDASRRLVAETDRLVVLDVRDLLPRRGRYLPRGRTIDRCIVHHTAGQILRPPEGLLRTAQFIVRSRLLGGRAWPGFPYTYYVPHNPDVWPDDWPWGDGRFVVYQTQSGNVVSWHTAGGGNPSGISVAFQKTARGDISAAQRVIAPSLWRGIIRPRFRIANAMLQTHSQYGKKACPGPSLEAWVRSERRL